VARWRQSGGSRNGDGELNGTGAKSVSVSVGLRRSERELSSRQFDFVVRYIHQSCSTVLRGHGRWSRKDTNNETISTIKEKITKARGRRKLTLDSG